MVSRVRLRLLVSDLVEQCVVGIFLSGLHSHDVRRVVLCEYLLICAFPPTAPRGPTTKKPAASSTASATSTTPSEKKVGGDCLLVPALFFL